MHELERSGHVQERLGVPEEEIPSRDQSFIEHIDRSPARARVEIDEDIAAKYDIGAPDDPYPFGVHQIEVPEVAQSAIAVRNMESVSLLVEIGPPELRGHRAE